MKLVARAQLDLVERLAARFSQQSSRMWPLDIHQSKYIALISSLRSVGHVFYKVDCDTPEKLAWQKPRWKEWQQEPIFAEFIEPARNVLLKEFEGGLTHNSPGMGDPGIVTEVGMPGMSSLVVDFDPTQAVAANGKPLLMQIRQAIQFWDRHLSEAENAFSQGQPPMP